MAKKRTCSEQEEDATSDAQQGCQKKEKKYKLTPLDYLQAMEPTDGSDPASEVDREFVGCGMILRDL